jgi:methionine sulfoxide reductase heme-binding subunit
MSAAAEAIETHGWWLASRASGLVALGLVTISVFLGLTLAGKVMRRPGLSKKLMALHEQTALAGLVAIAVHGIALLGDPWLQPGLVGVTVPFALGFKTFFTGLGVIAAYLSALLGLSFYVRRRIGAKLWRKAHRATILVYLLGLVHALGAGSDASAAWFRWWVMLTAPVIGGLFVYRLTRRRASAPSRRRGIAGPRPAHPIPAPSEWGQSRTGLDRRGRPGKALAKPLPASEEI